MSNVVFQNIDLSTKKYNRKRGYSNQTFTGSSGFELRVAKWSNTRFNWELEISMLDDSGLRNLASYQALEGFFAARNGDFDSFLFTDPRDNSTTGQFIATTVSGQTTYQLQRSIGSGTDFIFEPNGTVQLFLNGAAVSPSLFTVTPHTGQVVFGTAPTAGETLTATFSYYFRVRFVPSEMEFSSQVLNIWESASVALVETNQ